MELYKGLSFLIRAKNEEQNIIHCLTSLIEEIKTLDDVEIIVINNKSNDKTYELVENFIIDNKNIKLYDYNFEVCKIGNNIATGEYKTIATYYNWCLEKVTKYNVIKWDADFIVNKGELKNMINQNKLNIRDDNFKVWFTGTTLFENKNIYYKKINSYYDEDRIFSKKNGFMWIDIKNICETPNISNISINIKYKNPVFYEIKRTSIDEFASRDIFIDRRDTEDYNILNCLKNNKINNEIIIYDVTHLFN